MQYPKYDGYSTCKCGKRTYTNKKDAKIAKRRLFPHDGSVRAYACEENPFMVVWHLGHQTMPREFYRQMRETK